MVSCPGSLLEAVERLVEPADHLRTGGVNKPSRLTAVDCLSEQTMQKDFLHIQLVHWPRAGESQ
jgi:hypothetical protein